MLGFADDSFCASTTSGTYKTTTGSATCTDCGAGKYSTAVGLETASCVSCSTGTYQAMQGSSSCFLCGGTTTSNSGRTACICNSGYSGLPDGVYRWKLSGNPPFNAEWRNSQSQALFRIAARCPLQANGMQPEFCGVGDALSIMISSADSDAEWSGTHFNYTINFLPVVAYVTVSSQGCQVELSNSTRVSSGGNMLLWFSFSDLYHSFSTSLSVLSTSQGAIEHLSPAYGTIALDHCSACIAGKYKTSDSTLACTACVAGKYSTAIASETNSCLNCPSHAHSWQGSGLVTNCTCNAGYTGPNGLACVACAGGTYKDVSGSSPCSLCSQGKYSTETGEISESTCSDCPAHTHSPAGSVSFISCICNQGYTGANGAPSFDPFFLREEKKWTRRGIECETRAHEQLSNREKAR